jgi:hypothetical protein
VPLQKFAGDFLLSMKEFPPSQTAGSFNLDKIQKQIRPARCGSAAHHCPPSQVGGRSHFGTEFQTRRATASRQSSRQTT